MVRAILSVALVAGQFAFGQTARAVPPDRVPGSAIPPLQEPIHAKPARDVRGASAGPGASLPIRLSPLAPQLGHDPPPDAAAPRPQDYLNEITEIWNSAEMREARTFVAEFVQRSARTSPAEGELFLKQLSQLRPTEMRSWLERYQQRRMNSAVERSTEELARRLMVERALNRQEAMRQAAAHVSQLRAEATLATQMQRQMRSLMLQGGYPEDSFLLDLRPMYDPMDATTDPMNPRGYARRVAAAMTLPGDLPRDDPRNYDPNAADYGEWATTRDAAPPVE